ncbi:MAG: hypothetical protein RKO25_11025 [Candidatus Contendobacter sp.]|nr:hypothetical protein [Candidatus Contendobacter sp.]
MDDADRVSVMRMGVGPGRDSTKADPARARGRVVTASEDTRSQPAPAANAPDTVTS